LLFSAAIHCFSGGAFRPGGAARPGGWEAICRKPADSCRKAALFVAAPESSYINGHTLTVDGGWTAGHLREF